MVRLNFSAYPLQASLGALGRKWALLVLMNIALSRAQRFNQLLRTTPGMSKRMLALRLHDLEESGFIRRARQTRRYTRWQITPKGADVLPVLLTLIHFGSRWSSTSGPSSGEIPPLPRHLEVVFGHPTGAPATSRRRPARPVPRAAARTSSRRAR